MAPKRLTRKEIKEDPIQDALKQLAQGLSDNAKYLAGAALAVVLVFAAVYSWQRFSSGRQEELQSQFAEALEIYHSPLESEVPADGEKPDHQFKTAEERSQKALEAFKRLVEEHGGSGVGHFSLYYVALAEHDLGQQEQAVSDLEALIAKSNEPEVSALARNTLAQFYEAGGKTEQAIETWKRLLDGSDSKLPRDGILLKVAQAYETLGNKEEALKEYRKLLAEYPQSTHTRQVQVRVDLLEAAVGANAEASPDTPGEPKTDSGA